MYDEYDSFEDKYLLRNIKNLPLTSIKRFVIAKVLQNRGYSLSEIDLGYGKK